MATTAGRAHLAKLRDESERTKDAPYPAETRPTRPNRGRTRVYSIRLNEAEYEAVQRVADRAHLPASALVRSWVLSHLEEGA
jgi:hypothetical protein